LNIKSKKSAHNVRHKFFEIVYKFSYTNEYIIYSKMIKNVMYVLSENSIFYEYLRGKL